MKQIIFNFKGKDYTLEFNRASVRALEARGFVPANLGEKPMTLLPMLFRGAFMMHHATVKQDVIDEIYAKMPKKEELVVRIFQEPGRSDCQ